MDDESMPTTEMELLLEEVRCLRADLKVRDDRCEKLVREMDDIKSIINKLANSTYIYYEKNETNSKTMLNFGFASGIMGVVAVGVALSAFFAGDSPSMRSWMTLAIIGVLVLAVYALDQVTAKEKGMANLFHRICRRFSGKTKK